MNRLEITSAILNNAKICESLKKGYATIFPDAHLCIAEHEIEHHPRIQACIQLLRTGTNALPFHGYDSLESVNKIFCEHFLDTRNIHFQRCREQLLHIQDTPQFYSGIRRVGRILDEYQLGGSRMIRAACLARSHAVDESHFAEEIQEAINNFKQLSMVHDLMEIAEPQHGKWIIKTPGIPSYYHLQVLAFSKSWRNVATTTIVSRGIGRLFELQIPSLYLKHKSQIIAPANVGLHKILNPQNAHVWHPTNACKRPKPPSPIQHTPLA